MKVKTYSDFQEAEYKDNVCWAAQYMIDNNYLNRDMVEVALCDLLHGAPRQEYLNDVLTEMEQRRVKEGKMNFEFKEKKND